MSDITAETPITIKNPSLLAAIQRVQAIEATLGSQAQIDSVTFNVTVGMDHVDQMVERSLTATPLPAPTEPRDPQRIDRDIPITPDHLRLYNLILEGYSREFASADGSQILLKAAKARREQGIHDLRMSLIRPIAVKDVQGSTCVYGGSLEGATTIGREHRPKECDTLIHLTHPISPDDLLERESRPLAKRIVRYRILGLDDAAWERQNQSASWPLDPDAWDNLIFSRWNQAVSVAHTVWGEA